MGPKFFSIKAIVFQLVKTSITPLTCLCQGGHLHKWSKWSQDSKVENTGVKRYYPNDIEWNQWLLEIKWHWKCGYAFESSMCKFVISVRSYICTDSGSANLWVVFKFLNKLDENTIYILYLHCQWDGNGNKCMTLYFNWKHNCTCLEGTLLLRKATEEYHNISW